MRRSLLVLLPLLGACDNPTSDAVVESDVDTVVGTRDVTIHFEGVVGDQPFACRKRYEPVGASNSSVRVTDLRLFVHDVALHTADGTSHPLTLGAASPWQDGQVALVDLEDAAETCADGGSVGTNDVVVGTADDLDYTGISFRIGVPLAQNHPVTPGAAPLDATAMFRDGTSGFWFFRAGFTSVGQPDGWPVWVGSTGCTSDADGQAVCTSENVLDVSLDGFDPDTSVVTLDLGELVAKADLEHNGAGGGVAGPAGCTSIPSDVDCQTVIFPAYGLSTTAPTWIGAR